MLKSAKLKAIEREYGTKNERQEQKSLITDFTPFTGLRLRVPLQWVPIQLMAFKMVQNISGHQLRQQNSMLYRSLQDLLSENYQMAFKIQRSQLMQSMVDFRKNTTLGQFYSKNAFFSSLSL
jgi:hypothetical protein